MGKREDAEYYAKLSRSYKNLYDKEKHSFRPKEADGSFEPWPADGKLHEWYGCIECNELQQGWFVPHDIQGMVELMGGTEQVIADLDTMFAKTPDSFLWNAYYNHANEPVHHVPYLYNRLGQPWKTQKWSRFICDNAYHDKVEAWSVTKMLDRCLLGMCCLLADYILFVRVIPVMRLPVLFLK